MSSTMGTPAESPGGLVEPGYTTTEFYATMATNIMAIVAVVHPGFNAPPALAQALIGLAAGIGNAVYTIGRTLRKKG